jgi:hypothetical protein
VKKVLLTIIVGLFCMANSYAQVKTDSTKKIFNRVEVDDSVNQTNQDAIYARPFIGVGRSKTAVGGYLEANTNYFMEDGVSEGFSMELRRFNIFLYSAIGKRIKLLSELEFEHGTEEIALETALIDFEFHPAFNFRGGIILPQIGMFNANHDSPKWEVIDRPLVSTTLIPSTLSEVGFGAFGKFYPGNNILTYDFYVVNGLQDGIILNEDGRTSIPNGKSQEMFGEDNNGTPMLNGRVAFANRKIGEFGLSYYGGIYNSFALEGEQIDKKRSLAIMAFDFSISVKKFVLQGEVAAASIEVPKELDQFYGTQQWGGFVELIYPIFERKMLGFEESVIRVAARVEYVDYNMGSFDTYDQKIGEDVFALVFGFSYTPIPGTKIKANYRRHLTKDILGNPPVILGGFQFGVATYF